MKKISAIMLILSLFMLAGCEKEELNPDKEGYISADALFETARGELEELVAGDPYENVDFSAAVLSLSDEIGDIYELEVAARDDVYSQSEAVEIFERYVRSTFSDSEYADNKDHYRFLVPYGETPESYFNDEGVLVHPGIYESDHLDKIRSGEIKIDSLLFQTDTDEVHSEDEYFWWFPDGSGVKMNRGNCMRRVEKERRIAGWMPRDDYSVTDVYSLPNGKNFSLEDGKITIDEAAAFCEGYFANDAAFTKDTDANLKVFKASVLKIDDETDAFLFFLTPSYNSIPFDSLNTEGMVSEFSDGNKYSFNSSEALMTRSGGVEYCYLNGLNNKVTAIRDKMTDVISLKKAAQILSEKMTGYAVFEVNDISFVYCNKQAEEKDAPSEASPSWRFSLYNPNDSMRYMVYVNAADGHCFYYRYKG